MKKGIGHKTAKLAGAICGLCMILAMQIQVQAAGTVTVTPDKTAVAIGDVVNVTVQTSAPEDPATIPEVTVTYNADVLTFTGCNVEYGGGGGGLLTFKGQTATISFSAAVTGDVNVSAEAIIDDDGANPAVAAAAISVGADATGTLSSDATLYALEMDPGEMVPAFSSDVTEYKILIDNDVTDITVSGAVSDASAQITAASGFKNLKEGTNQAVITVTAADGTTLTYHFTIERAEAEAGEETEEEALQEEMESEQTSEGLNVTIDDVNYTIQSTVSEEMLPDGCVKTTSTFNGQPVEAALFEKGGLTLLYAVMQGEEEEEGDFFIYNEANGKLQFFIQLRSIENRFIVPITAQESQPAQFKAERMQWNNSFVPAYVLEDASVKNAEAFYLLYAVSNEGERGFYLYDTTEGTYQRFLDYTGAKAAVVTRGEGVGKNAILIIAVLAILLIGAVLLIVNMIIKNKELQEDVTFSGRTPAKKAAAKKKPVRKPEKRKTEPREPAKPKKAIKSESDIEFDDRESVGVAPKKPAEVASKKPAVRTVTPQPAEEKQVTGSVGITGNIPIKVVPTPKAETRRPMVPIYTLERPPVQLTREAPPDQLDDDFEFEFINMDNE